MTLKQKIGGCVIGISSSWPYHWSTAAADRRVSRQTTARHQQPDPGAGSAIDEWMN